MIVHKQGSLCRRRASLSPGLKSALVAFALFGAAQAAHAQANADGFTPPVKTTDSRGVDLVSAVAHVSIPLASFGEGATSLSASFDLSVPAGVGAIYSSDFVRTAGGTLGMSLQPKGELGGTGNIDELGSFANIVFPNGSGHVLTHQMNNYTNPDGTQYTRSIGPTHVTHLISADPNREGYYNAAGDRGILVASQAVFDRFVLANGEEWKFYRQWVTIPGQSQPIQRLRFVVSSRGYGIQFLYMTDVTPGSPTTTGTWMAPRKVTAYNKAFTFCDESLIQECAAVTALPSTDIVYNAAAGTATIKRAGSADGTELTFSKLGSNWYATLASMRHTAIPGSTISYALAISNAGGSYLQRLTDADGQWNYLYEVYLDDSGYVPESHLVATNPVGGVIETVGHTLFGQLMILNDEVPSSHWVSVSAHPGNYRVYGYMNPEQDSVVLDRDIRNNVIEAIRQPNNSQPPITFYRATYPADCMNPRTCNRPLSTTDANGKVTDFTYAPEHGGVLTETGPLVPTLQNDGVTTVNVRPQKRFEYTQRSAWLSNGAGGYAQSATAVWLLSRERFCRTTAASGSTCAGGAADEVVTDYDYGPASGPNNLALRGKAVTADSRTLRTCYAYDALGNKISETSPRAGLATCP